MPEARRGGIEGGGACDEIEILRYEGVEGMVNHEANHESQSGVVWEGVMCGYAAEKSVTIGGGGGGDPGRDDREQCPSPDKTPVPHVECQPRARLGGGGAEGSGAVVRSCGGIGDPTSPRRVPRIAVSRAGTQ